MARIDGVAWGMDELSGSGDGQRSTAVLAVEGQTFGIEHGDGLSVDGQNTAVDRVGGPLAISPETVNRSPPEAVESCRRRSGRAMRGC